MAYTTGKAAVITGAGSGIGRALARQLNSEGCELFISDINPDTLADTVASLPRQDVAVQQKILDVADKGAVHDWADEIAAARGHVDIVVNNAGVALMRMVEDCDYDNLEWLMGINFWGVVYGTQAFLPLLRKSQQGHLVNISSIFGMIAVPTQSAYNAAKFAVRGYTEALRQEMAGTNVHVCCVHPGGIRTNIARAARGGAPRVTPEERGQQPVNRVEQQPGVTAEERGESFEKVARTTPESAAAQIIGAIKKRKKRLLIGWDAKLIEILQRLFPVSYPRLLLRLGRPDHSITGQ